MPKGTTTDKMPFSLIYFVTTNNLIIIIFIFLQGFSHAFTYVYFPTWADQFGFQNYKTIMISFFQIASPLGSLIGFKITEFLGNFKYGFAFLAFTILTLNCILLFIPNKYCSPLIFFYKTIKEEHYGRESIYSLFEVDEEKEKKSKGASICYQLFKPVFAIIVLARTVLIFSLMSIHFWIGDYLENVFGQDDKVVKSSVYSIMKLVGTFTGNILGAVICDYFGGYKKRKSSLLCSSFSILTGICAILIPMTSNISIFNVELFFFFFFANSMMPILIGISFNSVDKKLKAVSYGMNSLMCIILGHLPAPFVYGFINGIYKDINKRIAMACNLNSIWVNTILISFNYYFRKGDNFEEGSDQNEIDTELKDME